MAMDVFDLVAKITLDSSEYEKEAQKLSKDAESGSGWGGKIVKGLGNIGKVGAVAFGAVGAAATAAATVMVKGAVDQYKEYEQLIGGVNKLFGTGGQTLDEYAASLGKTVDEVHDQYSSLQRGKNKVLANSEQAFMTAGMSANEYMDTVTGFSAALISSLGGDTEKAADVADIAIRSMSDNVNTFGGDIEGVKTAYMGFAKQNYTMLDNLKLGYGGTKQEMQRLIKDANKLRKEQGKNADLTIDSYADIIEAIQTIQEEQGIAGTTAKEAMTTISGSAAATKAAWKNVLTAIAGGMDGDIKSAMDGLVKSIFGTGNDDGFLNQIIPTIQYTLEGIADFIGQAAPLLAAKLPELVKAILPSLLTAAGSIMKAVASALPGLLKGIWDSIKAAAPALFEAAKEAFGKLKEAAGDVISKLPEKFGEIVTAISTWASEHGGEVLEKAKEIFGNLYEGIKDAVGKIPGALGDIITSIGSWVTEHGAEILTVGQNILSWIVSGIKTFIGDVANGLVNLVSTIATWVSNHGQDILAVGQNILGWIASGIKKFIKDIWNGFGSLIETIGNWITNNSGNIEDTGHSIIDWIKNGIKEWISHIKDGFADMVLKIQEKINSIGAFLLSIGRAILQKIINGIKDWIGHIADWVKDIPAKIQSGVNGIISDLMGVGAAIINKIKAGITDNGITSKIVGIAQKAAQAAKRIIDNTSKYVSGAEQSDLNALDIDGTGKAPKAKATFQPYLFNKATVFGRYRDKNLVAGEAQPEMLLGVQTLRNMLYESVQAGTTAMAGQIVDAVGNRQDGGSAALQREIINVLNAYLPMLASQQVVLDSGALVGAIAPGIDSNLGNTAGNKRRYAAS